jgi:hypothetical protein
MHTITGAGKAATHDGSRRDGNHADYFPATPHNVAVTSTWLRGAAAPRGGRGL